MEKEYRKRTKETKKLKEQKGITLITLVVTILIILILAGVSINAVFNDSGLLSQAQEMKDMAENKVEQDDEEINTLLEEHSNIMKEDSEIPVE